MAITRRRLLILRVVAVACSAALIGGYISYRATGRVIPFRSHDDIQSALDASAQESPSSLARDDAIMSSSKWAPVVNEDIIMPSSKLMKVMDESDIVMPGSKSGIAFTPEDVPEPDAEKAPGSPGGDSLDDDSKQSP